ncbi:lysM and putative peptidoglycan-binding domain-containing protein 1 [Balearica regulorum gibbericeps]|uniref:lysM and putative peptidoglycan-binding domain-containing protein 1 n=1 Tax=Balearica regulorum gibbericeps TaxID=100784 RepID=UPI003F6380F0
MAISLPEGAASRPLPPRIELHFPEASARAAGPGLPWPLRSYRGPGAPGGGGGAEPAPVNGGRSAGALGRSPRPGRGCSHEAPPALAGAGVQRGRPAMAAGSGGAGASAREHRLEPGDTLPGLALRYGVTMEQIKRANRLYTSDTIFLKPTLLIPAPVTPGGPCPADQDTPVPPGDTPAAPVPSRHDLSATDFLRQLDAEIGRSKAAAAAAQRLRAGSTGTAEGEGTRSPDAKGPLPSRGPCLGPRPLTRTPRVAALRDAEDEIFTL